MSLFPIYYSLFLPRVLPYLNPRQSFVPDEEVPDDDVERAVAVDVGKIQRGVARRLALERVLDEHALRRLLEPDERRRARLIARLDRLRHERAGDDVEIAVAVEVSRERAHHAGHVR